MEWKQKTNRKKKEKFNNIKSNDENFKVSMSIEHNKQNEVRRVILFVRHTIIKKNGTQSYAIAQNLQLAHLERMRLLHSKDVYAQGFHEIIITMIVMNTMCECVFVFNKKKKSHQQPFKKP